MSAEYRRDSGLEQSITKSILCEYNKKLWNRKLTLCSVLFTILACSCTNKSSSLNEEKIIGYWHIIESTKNGNKFDVKYPYAEYDSIGIFSYTNGPESYYGRYVIHGLDSLLINADNTSIEIRYGITADTMNQVYFINSDLYRHKYIKMKLVNYEHDSIQNSDLELKILRVQVHLDNTCTVRYMATNHTDYGIKNIKASSRYYGDRQPLRAFQLGLFARIPFQIDILAANDSLTFEEVFQWPQFEPVYGPYIELER